MIEGIFVVYFSVMLSSFRLDHDHIIKMLDICPPDDLEHFDELYIVCMSCTFAPSNKVQVLEIADSDFKKLFRTPVFLTELHIKTLLYNLLVGVKYLHSAGILHRDLVLDLHHLIPLLSLYSETCKLSSQPGLFGEDLRLWIIEGYRDGKTAALTAVA